MTRAPWLLVVGCMAMLAGCTSTIQPDPTQGGRCFLGENLVDRYQYVTCIPTPTGERINPQP